MKILLKGGRIVDPSQNIDSTMDILIEGDTISRIENTIDPVAGAQVFDLKDKVVSPGLIDMHTHLREPGFEYKETIRTGSEAAVAGGFTAIACMANTEPVNDNRSITEFILKQARLADMAHVYPVAAVSKGLKGKTLAEFGELKDAGAVALSDDGNPVEDSGLMKNALEYAYSLGMPVISHCEDKGLASGGVMNEGLVSTLLGLQGIPNIAEDIMTSRDIAIAGYTGTSVHISHVSTAGSVRAVREAKKMGIKVTAETAPHYFALTDDALKGYSTDFKMYPPLRSREDTEAIMAGLQDGTIDAIASDHAPHSTIEKDVEFDYAANGIIGLETSLSVSMKLVDEGILSLGQLIEKMSTNPAAILKIPKDTLQKGATANITVIDTHKVWTVDSERFRSKSRNTPFQGWQLKGKAVLTIVSGKVKYSEMG